MPHGCPIAHQPDSTPGSQPYSPSKFHPNPTRSLPDVKTLTTLMVTSWHKDFLYKPPQTAISLGDCFFLDRVAKCLSRTLKMYLVIFTKRLHLVRTDQIDLQHGPTRTTLAVNSPTDHGIPNLKIERQYCLQVNGNKPAKDSQTALHVACILMRQHYPRSCRTSYVVSSCTSE